MEHGTCASIVADLLALAADASAAGVRWGFSEGAACSTLGVGLWTGSGIVPLLSTGVAGAGEAGIVARGAARGRLGIEFGAGAGIVTDLQTLAADPVGDASTQPGRSAGCGIGVDRGAGAHIVSRLSTGTTDAELGFHETHSGLGFSIYEWY